LFKQLLKICNVSGFHTAMHKLGKVDAHLFFLQGFTVLFKIFFHIYRSEWLYPSPDMIYNYWPTIDLPEKEMNNRNDTPRIIYRGVARATLKKRRD